MTTTAYLDHAATTPVLAEVVEVVTRASRDLGNPSSLHATGRRARRAVEESRERVAGALGARPSEVIFTSGGTESDNLAVKGIYWARSSGDTRRTVILTSAIEHHAVLDTAEWLGRTAGATPVFLAVDEAGRIRPEQFRAALERHADAVAVATIMWANNEIGTIQPVAEIAGIAAEAGVPLHTDAVQAIGQVPVGFSAAAPAALTLTGHKLGGPHGVGALLLGRDVPCAPLLHGGGQEREVRSGTLNTPGIVGLAVAVEIAVSRQEQRAALLTQLRDRLVLAVRAAVPDAIYNGDPVHRLPGNAHFSFPGCEGDALLMLLDARGIECSTGSACSAGVAQPSHVLVALGADLGRARGSLRFSLGHTSTMDEIEALGAAIGPVVERARRAF